MSNLDRNYTVPVAVATVVLTILWWILFTKTQALNGITWTLAIVASLAVLYCNYKSLTIDNGDNGYKVGAIAGCIITLIVLGITKGEFGF